LPLPSRGSLVIFLRFGIDWPRRCETWGCRMAAEDEADAAAAAGRGRLQNFILYAARSVSRKQWRVLKIDRSQPSELNIYEDPITYKRLLCTVDLTKDFFFSYSYNIMRSLQKNMCDGVPEEALYETMFVWNEFLSCGVRNHLKNTAWTVALVHGSFKQVKKKKVRKAWHVSVLKT
ncbi:hypothetical protein GW17_00006452, partial [Ensete ventricosum]